MVGVVIEKLNKALATRVKKYVKLNIADRVRKYLDETQKFAKEAKQGILDRLNATRDGAILVATNVRDGVQEKVDGVKQAVTEAKQALELGREKALEQLGTHKMDAITFASGLKARFASKVEQIKGVTQEAFTAMASTPMTVANAMSASVNRVNTARREENDRLAHAFVTKVVGNAAPLSRHFLSEVLERGLDPNAKVTVKQSENEPASEMTLLEYAVVNHMKDKPTWSGGSEVISRLILAGADIHAMNSEGSTLVERAFAGKPEVGELILSAYNEAKTRNPSMNRGALTL